MNDKTTGGPAFPLIPPADEHGHSPSGYPYPDSGMTLRDYFAGQALVALPPHLRVLQTDHRINIAEWAYGLADAMIAERSK